MKDHDPVVDSLHSESPRSSEDAMSSERLDPSRIPSVAPGGIARQRLRVAGRTLGSLLLGGAAVLGSVLVFRQGLLPLIDTVFQPGPNGSVRSGAPASSCRQWRATGLTCIGMKDAKRPSCGCGRFA